MLVLFSCKKEVSYSLPTKVIKASKYCTQETVKFSADTFQKSLNINLSIGNFPLEVFPIKGRDTLSRASFKIEIKDNGVPIKPSLLWFYSDTVKYTYNKYLNNYSILNTDTFDLRGLNSYELSLPFYLFRNLKAGLHNLSVSISQNSFQGWVEDSTLVQLNDTAKTKVWKKFPKTLSSSKLQVEFAFQIRVPKVYQTDICISEVELRNDSVYSPSGSDNTIFQSSYPDLYFSSHNIQVGSPSYYFSPTVKSTSDAIYNDTIHFLHYYPKDSISFSLFDHDNWSKDDYIDGLRIPIPAKNGKDSTGTDYAIKKIKYSTKATKLLN